MFILDTDILSLLHAGDPRLQRYKNRFAPGEVVTTVITRLEILRGRFDYVFKAADGRDLLRALDWLNRSEALLAEITVLSFDDAAAQEFDELRQNKKLKKIGRADLLIASMAIARRAAVVTRNVKDFQQVPGLQIENWLD